MVELLEYWADEPPAHVILAMRYLGDGKRNAKGVTEEEARSDLGQMAGMLGQQPQKLPNHLKSMIQQAEEVKARYKGL